MTGEKMSTNKFYDVVWGNYTPPFKESKKHLQSFFEVEEIAGKRILDAGCGTGIFSLIMAEMGAKEVIGIDISQGSLKTARKLRSRKNLEKNCKFQIANMLDLPFDDENFDIVWAWGSVHHSENPIQAMSELFRVLKPGGKILLALYKKTKLTPIHEKIREILIKFPKNLHVHISKILSAFLFPFVHLFKKREKHRGGEKLEELILDWYFVPTRHYFLPLTIKNLLQKNGFQIEKYLPASGRFDSTSNFIYKAKLKK